MSAAALEFLALQRVAHADLSDQLTAIEEAYNAKLWHQLTVLLAEFVRDPRTNRGDNLIQLYENFITSIEARINPLQLVLLTAQIATQLYPSRPYVPAELDAAAALLTRVLSKRDKPVSSGDRLPDDAFLVARMEVLSLSLRKAGALASPADAPALTALLDETKKALAEGRALLEALPAGSEPVAAATFHRVSAEYYKIRGPAASFFASALAFVAHTPLEALPAEARASLAVDLTVAALVGDKVFSFGELAAHPLMQALDGTPHAWLGALLRAVSRGDVAAFNALLSTHGEALRAQTALAASVAMLKEKLVLMSVVELAASRPPAERAIPFADVAAATQLPVAQVDWLLMRCMSVGLIRAHIDGVDQVVRVTYVAPRVLDADQTRDVKARVDDLRAAAKETLTLLEARAAEIVV